MTSSLNSAWLTFMCLQNRQQKKKTHPSTLTKGYNYIETKIPWFSSNWPSIFSSPDFQRKPPAFCNSLKCKFKVMLPCLDWESWASSSHPLLPWEHDPNLGCQRLQNAFLVTALCVAANWPSATNELKCIFLLPSEFRNIPLHSFHSQFTQPSLCSNCEWSQLFAWLQGEQARYVQAQEWCPLGEFQPWY